MRTAAEIALDDVMAMLEVRRRPRRSPRGKLG